jgi:hypothetical protein
MSWAFVPWLVFWSWVVFFRGAEWLDGFADGWVSAYLVEPLPAKTDPVHVLRILGVINLLAGIAAVLVVLL